MRSTLQTAGRDVQAPIAAKEWQALCELSAHLQEPETAILAAARWLRIRRRDGRTVKLRANAAQRCYQQRRGQHNIVLKARQMGATTWIAGQFFLRTITQPGTLTLLVAHTQSAAQAMLTAVERMWTYLPDDLRNGALRRDRAHASGMRFAEIGSEFRVASAADPNAGRGLSVQNLHCSEVSRWPGDAAATLAGLRAALAPGGELVLESTPNGAYGAFWEEWQKGEGSGFRERRAADSGSSLRDSLPRNTGASPLRALRSGRDDGGAEGQGLVRHFLPWWMEPAYVGAEVAPGELTDEEHALQIHEGLSGRQIGFRRGLAQSFGVLRMQEFAEDPETCFRATGACCFDAEAIESRLAELQPAAETRRGGALEVYLPPASGRDYCVAVDSAGGGEDGDFAAVQVVELSSGLQCAELQERLRPAELAQVAAELAREYDGALLAVERNNHGAAVLAYLETSERYRRVFSGKDGEPGWLTTAVSKAEMIAGLERLLRETPRLFASRRLLRECRSFVSANGGRVGAARGMHDDLVIAMGIAQAVRGERAV